MACVDARLWACGPRTHHWADPPIQNRRIRRCGGGLEPVLLQRSSPVRPAGSDQELRCPSQPWWPSPHHVGVITRALPPVLQGKEDVGHTPSARPRCRRRLQSVAGVVLSCKATSLPGWWGRGGVLVKPSRPWHNTLELVCGLPCKPFPKTEWPWRAHTGLERGAEVV